MLSSIWSNGGFWISRYEMGVEGSDSNPSLRISGSNGPITDDSPAAASKMGLTPYCYVPSSKAQVLASRVDAGEGKMCTLLFGIQWDLTCKYLDSSVAGLDTKGNCDSWGNFSSSSLKLDRGMYNSGSGTSEWINVSTETPNRVVLSAGASDQTNKMNIFDFAGNCEEWTLEMKDGSYPSCAKRGGTYNYPSTTMPANDHSNLGTYGMGTGFRATIY